MSEINKNCPVNRYDIDGEYLDNFDNMVDASHAVKATVRSILKAVKITNMSVNGYFWRLRNQNKIGKDIIV